MKLCALLFALPCLAADIVPAVVDPVGSLVAIESSTIQWKPLALQVLGAGIEKPTAARVRELWAQRHEVRQDTSVPFTAAAPASLRQQHYYLVSANGVTEILPSKLSGSVEYYWRPGKTPQVQSVHYSGNILLEPPRNDPRTEGGFVFVSREPLTFRATTQPKEAVTASRETGALTFREGNQAKSAKFQWFSYDAIPFRVMRLTLTTSNEDYLFVQWEPSDTDCYYFYTLMKFTGAGIEQASSHGYRCDI